MHQNLRLTLSYFQISYLETRLWKFFEKIYHVWSLYSGVTISWTDFLNKHDSYLRTKTNEERRVISCDKNT